MDLLLIWVEDDGSLHCKEVNKITKQQAMTVALKLQKPHIAVNVHPKNEWYPTEEVFREN